jgi:hypothetical protein
MNAAVIFGVILIVLLIAASITFLILWLNKRNEKKTANKDLAIADVNFIPGETSITATWTVVGNEKDEVILYADTKPIKLNANGEPVSENVKSSNKVSGNSKIVTITNLERETKYYLELVVKNPNVTGFNPNTGTVVTGSNVIPQGNFIIQEIHTPGGISLDVNDSTKVTYEQGANKADTNDLWTYDPEKMTLTTRNVGATSTALRPTLYNNNGILAAKPEQTNPTSDSQWTFENHKWCIKGTDTCMFLESPIAKSGQEIKLTTSSNTQWVNTLVKGV